MPESPDLGGKNLPVEESAEGRGFDQRLEDAESAQLVRRIQAGERDCFAELYTKYFDRVYGYLRVVLKDSHEAEDVAQQAFAQVIEALPRYEIRKQPFRAWLYTIVRNLAISYLRKHGRTEAEEPETMARHQEREAMDAEQELPVLSWISDRDLQIFIERLPLAQRQALALRFMLDMSADEIAQVLDLTPTNVRGLQHRGLSFLRARLAAVGRRRTGEKPIRMRGRFKQAPVLRARRFALRAP
jgi:RNA polymerase sigma-70 factor (ECF subfamily)